jgi:hypothetical protein
MPRRYSWPTSTGRALNASANFPGEPLEMRWLNGSSEGMLLRADAGSTPANPSRNTIANMVADSFQVMFNFSRNQPFIQHLALCVGHLGGASDCHSFHFTYVHGLLFRLPAYTLHRPSF